MKDDKTKGGQYHTCSKCKRDIKIDKEPEFQHVNEHCQDFFCIWCVYQTFTTQMNKMMGQLKYKNKNKTDLAKDIEKGMSEYPAKMPCCNRFSSKAEGILMQMKQFLKSNCCIHGMDCQQITKRDNQQINKGDNQQIKKGHNQQLKKEDTKYSYQFDNNLTVGIKCYRQLSNRNVSNIQSMTKNDIYSLQQLNKLSTKKCVYCLLRPINIVIGSDYQTKDGSCRECSYLFLNEQKGNKQIRDVQERKYQQPKQMMVVTQNPIEYQINSVENKQHHHKQNIINSIQPQHGFIQNIANESKQNNNPTNDSSKCCECGQKFKLVLKSKQLKEHQALDNVDLTITLAEYNQKYYCYYCLYDKQFGRIKNQKILKKISQLLYVQQLIKFQQIYYSHCLICGVNLQSMDQKCFVFSVPSKSTNKLMGLQVCYCACCDKLMRDNVKVYKNLINLKDLLNKRNQWQNNTSNNRMTVCQYRRVISSKLNQLLTVKQTLMKENINKDKAIIKDNNRKELKIKQRQRQQKERSQIWVQDEEGDHYQQAMQYQQQTLQQQQTKQVQQQQNEKQLNMTDNNQQQKQQQQKQESQQQVFEQPTNQQQGIIIINQNTNRSFNNNNSASEYDFDHLLKNKLIDYTNQQQQQQQQLQDINSEDKISQTNYNNASYLIQNPQSHHLSIQIIEQIHRLTMKNQYHEIDKQQSIKQKCSNENFSAKQFQCSNCNQLDFLLSFGSLCQSCFTKYLLGFNNIKINNSKEINSNKHQQVSNKDQYRNSLAKNTSFKTYH